MDKATVTPISKDADWPPEQIIQEAAKRKFERVIVIGFLDDNSEHEDRFWISGSMNSDAETCDLLALAAHWLMQQRMGDE